jgi:hypothetical protein
MANLGHEKLADEQILYDERRHSALPTRGRFGERPHVNLLTARAIL